jgi:hypothetical protein
VAINLPVANYLTSDVLEPAAVASRPIFALTPWYSGRIRLSITISAKPAVCDQHVFTRVRIPGEDEDLEREVDARARPDWAKIFAE